MEKAACWDCPVKAVSSGVRLQTDGLVGYVFVAYARIELEKIWQ